MRFRHFILLVIALWAVMTGLADDHDIVRYTFRWSPDGEWTAVGHLDGIVTVASSSNSQQKFELKHDAMVGDIEWSPDSSRIATTTLSPGGIIYIWDVKTGSLIKTLQADISPDGGTDIAWNPKREILATIGFMADGGMPVQFWDTQTYEQIGWATYAISVSMKWSPDGSYLAVTRNPAGLSLYDKFDVADIQPKAELSGVSYIDWSPDSTQIAAFKFSETMIVENNVGRYERENWLTILDSNSLKEIAQLSQPSHDPAYPLTWSPDGSRIAILAGDRVDIIDAKSAALIKQYPVDPGYITGTWSPFGGRLAINAHVGFSTKNATQASDVLGITFVVPAPTHELLASIQAQCVPEGVISKLPNATIVNTTSYIDAVSTDPSISSGCADDLVAVAESLQVEQKSQ